MSESNFYSIAELNKVFIEKNGLKKVEFLGKIPKKLDTDIDLEKLSVYRYMRYPHVKEMLAGKSPALFFVSPTKWEDPMERRFINGKYDKAKNFEKKPLACMCVTTNAADNEAAAWVMYDKDRKHDLVRLTLNFANLLRLLDDYVADKDAKVYVAGVNYVPVEKINSPKVADAKKFKDKDFLKLMLLKRKSYMFEGEIRIMIYGKDVSLSKDGFLQVPIKRDAMIKGDAKKPFINVRVAPDAPERAVTKEQVVSEIGKIVSVNQSRLNKQAHEFHLK